MLTLAALARRMGARVEAHLGGCEVNALALPLSAGPCDVTLQLEGVTGPRSVAESPALAVVSRRARADGRAFLVDDVVTACARLRAWLPVRRARSVLCGGHVHHTARVDAGTHVADGVSIGEGTVVAAGAVIEAGVRIGAFCRVGAGAVIGGMAELGNRVTVGAGCAVGSDGFAFVRDGSQWLRMPVFGSVTIGDDVELLDHVVVHAGVFGDTLIGRGCTLDSHVLIGHDARVGEHTAMAGHSALAGAAVVGRRCRIGGKAGIGEGVRIADDVTIGAMSLVSRSIDAPGSSHTAAWPAEPSMLWWRRVARWRRLFGHRGVVTDAEGRGAATAAGAGEN